MSEFAKEVSSLAFCADSTTVVYPLFQAESGGSIPTSALQFNVIEIGLDRIIELNKKWHSRLPKIDKSNIQRSRWYKCYGAEFDDNFFAVALWTNPIARLIDDGFTFELRRMAVSNVCPKNTPSRFLSIMTRIIRAKIQFLKRLVSYQDTEVHTGTIYKASGWMPVARNECGKWNRPNRPRDASQSNAPKIRWEKSL